MSELEIIKKHEIKTSNFFASASFHSMLLLLENRAQLQLLQLLVYGIQPANLFQLVLLQDFASHLFFLQRIDFLDFLSQKPT